MIVRDRVVLRRTVVGDSHWRFHNLCESHHQSQDSEFDFTLSTWLWWWLPLSCRNVSQSPTTVVLKTTPSERSHYTVVFILSKRNVFFLLDLELNTTKMTLAKLEKVKFYSLDQEIHEKVKKAKSKPGRNLVLIWSHVTGEIVRIWRKRTSINWPSAAVRVATKNPGWVACRWRCVTSSPTPPRPINSSLHWCSPLITVRVSEHASKLMLLNFWRMTEVS